VETLLINARVRSSQNKALSVNADLGLPDSEEMQIKARLATKISDIISQR
jgi:hypothetical protein